MKDTTIKYYNKGLKNTRFLLLDSGGLPRFNPPQSSYASGSYRMEKLTELLAQMASMGGNAAYVWPSFIIAFVVMLTMVITSMRSLRKVERTLAELQDPNRETP
jgi:heme exporter protein CcmD